MYLATIAVTQTIRKQTTQIRNDLTEKSFNSEAILLRHCIYFGFLFLILISRGVY